MDPSHSRGQISPPPVWAEQGSQGSPFSSLGRQFWGKKVGFGGVGPLRNPFPGGSDPPETHFFGPKLASQAGKRGPLGPLLGPYWRGGNLASRMVWVQNLGVSGGPRGGFGPRKGPFGAPGGPPGGPKVRFRGVPGTPRSDPLGTLDTFANGKNPPKTVPETLLFDFFP